MSFTNFCARSGGSNLFAGTVAGDTTEPATSVTYTAVGDSDGTSQFTPSDGSTPASTVSAGMFGAVFVTAGATTATFIGRITTVAAGVNGAITFSTTAKSGTFPAASAGAHTITINVGGAWKGPNAAVSFPFGFVTAAMTNTAGDAVRVNFKNDATYSITSAMTHGVAGYVGFEGYAASYHDGGRATIDGGTSGASYVLLTMSSFFAQVESFIFSNNGASGSAALVVGSSTLQLYRRCVFTGSRGGGLSFTANSCTAVECEAYACNASNTAGVGGLMSSAASHYVRCVSHDNTGGNNVGFYTTSVGIYSRCVSESNGSHGFWANSNAEPTMSGCDAYNNGGSGLFFTTHRMTIVENSNFVKNGGYGISGAGAAGVGIVSNCGFSSGTQANSSGATNALGSIDVSGSVTYAADVTPWADPANGDFRITLGAAKGAGRGTFTETATSYTGTVGYPDIGAAQSRGGGISRGRLANA